MRDRYLFSADRTSSEYRTVLEITPGRARLLTPSLAARYVRWIVSIGLGIFYYTVASLLLVEAFNAYPVLSANPVAVVLLAIAVVVLWFLGLLGLFYWWDRRSLPLLADAPSEGTDLVLLGARSFGTFQDVRARTAGGSEMHLVVDARESRFWEAVRLLEGKAAASR